VHVARPAEDHGDAVGASTFPGHGAPSDRASARGILTATDRGGDARRSAPAPGGLLDLFDAAGEEFGERTLADVDLEDLQTLRTIGDLAEAIIDWATTTEGLDR
jgi:hypothetical protein